MCSKLTRHPPRHCALGLHLRNALKNPVFSQSNEVLEPGQKNVIFNLMMCQVIDTDCYDDVYKKTSGNCSYSSLQRPNSVLESINTSATCQTILTQLYFPSLIDFTNVSVSDACTSPYSTGCTAHRDTTYPNMFRGSFVPESPSCPSRSMNCSDQDQCVCVGSCSALNVTRAYNPAGYERQASTVPDVVSAVEEVLIPLEEDGYYMSCYTLQVFESDTMPGLPTTVSSFPAVDNSFVGHTVQFNVTYKNFNQVKTNCRNVFLLANTPPLEYNSDPEAYTRRALDAVRDRSYLTDYVNNIVRVSLEISAEKDADGGVKNVKSAMKTSGVYEYPGPSTGVDTGQTRIMFVEKDLDTVISVVTDQYTTTASEYLSSIFNLLSTLYTFVFCFFFLNGVQTGYYFAFGKRADAISASIVSDVDAMLAQADYKSEVPIPKDRTQRRYELKDTKVAI